MTGYAFSYIGPLVFVLTLTLAKEAVDDFQRLRRDYLYNSETFEVLTIKGTKKKKNSGNLKVGDIVWVTSGQRIPADMILLYTT